MSDNETLIAKICLEINEKDLAEFVSDQLYLSGLIDHAKEYEIRFLEARDIGGKALTAVVEIIEVKEQDDE
jgi:hypothetical protein